MTYENYIGALEVLGIWWCQVRVATGLMPRHLVRDWGCR